MSEPLSDFEKETLNLMAGMLINMLRVDGFMDIQNAEKFNPDIQNDYIRYGSHSIQAYREHRALINPPTNLREFIMCVMAHADGYMDYGSAVTDSPELKDAYDRYSLAAVLTIHMYQTSPNGFLDLEDRPASDDSRKRRRSAFNKQTKQN